MAKKQNRNTYVVEVDGQYLTRSRLILKPVPIQDLENEEEKSSSIGITAEEPRQQEKSSPSPKLQRSKWKCMKGQ